MTALTPIAYALVGSGGQQTIVFNSIPNTYTDLRLAISARTTGANPEDLYIQFNSDNSASYSFRRLYGTGSGRDADAILNNATAGRIGRINSAGYTSNSFATTLLYIPSYRSATAKNLTSETVEENNATQAFQMIFSALWNNGSVINSIQIGILSGANFAQYSSATLYGITAGSSGGVTVS